MKPIIASAVCATLVGCAPSMTARQPKADAVLRNGSVYTVDARDSVQQAVAVRDGRIVFVGSDGGAEEWIGSQTQVIDLKGKMLMPGLIDGHIHPLGGGAQLRTCSLEFLPLTEAEFLARIQACLDASKDGPDEALTVSGWYRQFMRPKGTDGTRDMLDKLQTTRPIIVRNRDGHSSLVNSRALELSGITDSTPNPPGGRIDRDKSGRATGILEDGAAALVRVKMPARGPNDALADAETAMKTLTRAGVTTILDALGSEGSAQTYTALQKAGKLNARVHIAVRMGRVASTANVGETVASVVRVRDQFDQPHVAAVPGIRVHTVKMMLDGVIQAPAQTASLLAPYWVNVGDSTREKWQPGPNPGPPVYIEQNFLNTLVIAFAKAGIDAHIHAIGDGAVRVALDAFAKMREVVPGDEVRPAIAHAELVHPDDYARFRTLNAVPVMSYQWSIPAPNSVTGAKNHLGPERFERMEPFDALDRAGVRVVYGSDWPVDRMNYWLALKGGITRAGDGTYGEEFGGRLNQAPGLTRASALRSITLNGAWALHREKEIGSIETGKLADLIVLDRNFMTIPEDTLADNKVLLTMVGGKIVHDDGLAGTRK